jgi:hypothetical protein
VLLADEGENNREIARKPEFGISKTASSRKKDKKKRRQVNWDRS